MLSLGATGFRPSAAEQPDARPLVHVLLVLGGLRLAGTVGGKERAPPRKQPLCCSDGEVEDDDTLDEHDRI